MKRLALILLALPTLAFAQDGALAQDDGLAQEDEDAPARNVIYQKATEIDFGAVDVNAALNRPGIQIGFEVRRSVFNPLIRLRTDFNVEMDASVGDVK